MIAISGITTGRLSLVMCLLAVCDGFNSKGNGMALC